MLADSIDFLEDASVNLLIALAMWLAWPPRRRALLGMVLALPLLAPGLATPWMAWQKLQLPTPPNPALLADASGWPDLIVGIAVMIADAAKEVWEAAREERKAAAEHAQAAVRRRAWGA